MNYSKCLILDRRITNIAPMESIKKPALITFVNTYSYYKIIDSNFDIERFNYIGIDGQLQVKLHNLFNINKVMRYSFDFSSYAVDFFEYCSKYKKSIALIGGTEQEIKSAVNYYNKRYNGIIINYYSSGFVTSEQKEEFIKKCINNDVDYLVVGMGTPLQEETAIQAQNLGFDGIVFTCGGFIYQTSQKGDYYNPIIKKLNLRWLQRFVENKTVRKRVFIDYPKNIIKYLFSHLMMKIKK